MRESRGAGSGRLWDPRYHHSSSGMSVLADMSSITAEDTRDDRPKDGPSFSSPFDVHSGPDRGLHLPPHPIPEQVHPPGYPLQARSAARHPGRVRLSSPRSGRTASPVLKVTVLMPSRKRNPWPKRAPSLFLVAPALARICHQRDLFHVQAGWHGMGDLTHFRPKTST